MPRQVLSATLTFAAPACVGLGVVLIAKPVGWAIVPALLAALVVALWCAHALLRQIEALHDLVDGLAEPPALDDRLSDDNLTVNRDPAMLAASGLAASGLAASGTDIAPDHHKRRDGAHAGTSIWFEPLARIARTGRREATRFADYYATQKDRLARFEAVAHVLPEAVILIDRGGQIVSANAVARQLFGRDSVGADIYGLVRDPAFHAVLPQVLEERGTASVEFVVDTPEERSIRALIRTVQSVAADDIAAVIVLQDVTALRRVDQMRVDFVANVSHELRTPLSSLIGFLETLRGPASADEAARTRFLEIMQEQAERMSRIVEDLLSLTQIEMDAAKQPTEPVAVLPVIQQLVEALQLRAAQKGLRFVVSVPDDLASSPPIVMGDRDQIAQLMQNLMDNAMKYGGRDTTIDIRVTPLSDPGEGVSADSGDRPMIRVDVIDHGEGIEPEHLARLTERFYRVDKARSREIGGTGLGLAIVKHIVNRHQGRLEIDSMPGSGSTFSVILPAAL